MATIQSPPASAPPNDSNNSGNPVAEIPKPANADDNGVKQGSASDSVPPPPFKISQPIREDQVQNAVNFLTHPRVRNSPVVHRRSFLEKKGLTKEEIDEAFRRVPDPAPNSTAVETATASPASSQNLPTTVAHVQTQPQNSQLPVASVASASMTPTMQQTQYKWSSILLAVGVVAASGAGSALLFKKVVIPKLKGWIRKVAAENEDSEKGEKTSSKIAEEAAEAAKAAASAAAIVAKASQDLLGSKSEEKKYFEAFMGALDVQVKEMKSMAESIRKLESRKDDGVNEDKLRMEQYQSTVGNGHNNNGPFNNTWVNKQYKVNGTSNRDFGEVRPSSAPVSMEPASVPPGNSYMEYMEMAQRGEKPPGVKPWEVPQQVQHNYSNSIQYHSSDEGSNFANQESFSSSQTNGKAHDPAEPWWKKKSAKIAEIQSEMTEARQFPYSTEAAEKPKQRTWVPPQPPAVAMPEAAAAIRKPKTAPKQQSSDSRSVVSSDDGEEGLVATTNSVNDGGSSGNLIVDTYQSEIQEVKDDVIEVN